MESCFSLWAELLLLCVMVCKDQRIENRFGLTRLSRLSISVTDVLVVRLSLIPKTNPFPHIGQYFQFVVGRGLLGHGGSKSWTRKNIGQNRKAGDTESPVVTNRTGPAPPGNFSLVKVDGGGLGVPRLGSCAPRM